MINSIKHILNFIGLIVVQVLVIDQIDFLSLNTFISPIIIGTYLFLMPLGWRTNRLLFLAFFMGLLLDSFHNTLGMNTSAMVLLAFLKPLFLRIVLPREGVDLEKDASIFTLKLPKYLIFSGISFFVYHLAYFSLESLIIDSVLNVFLKTIASTIFAVLLSILYQYLTIKKH